MLSDAYPAYPAQLAKEVVTAAHFNLERLKELVSSRPQLSNAAWDWGFGDWETPLGAASHMGRRDIAEYLMSQGAPPTIFSSAMLGDLNMVRSFVAARPGVQRLSGPHSISLLAHARMGGKQSAAVLEHLHTLTNADMNAPAPLSAEEQQALSGDFVFGPGESERIQISTDLHMYANNPMYTYSPQLNWTRKDTMGRPLFHLGDRTFFPAGASAVRIRFEGKPERLMMTVNDGGEELTAVRNAGN